MSQNCGDAAWEAKPVVESGCKHGSCRGGKPLRRRRLCEAERNQVAKEQVTPPRKAAIVDSGPVPKTDTGGQGEEPKADGRSIVKELGKITP